jgi:hypothetical protein
MNQNIKQNIKNLKQATSIQLPFSRNFPYPSPPSLLKKCLINGLLLLSAVSFITDARLIRSGGRTTSTGSVLEDFYFVEHQYFNEVGLSPDNFNAGNYSKISIGGGINKLYAAPSECNVTHSFDDEQAWDDERAYILGLDSSEISDEDRQDALDAVGFQGEPCTWEFAKDENLFLFGEFLVYFPTGGLFDVDWTISDGLQSWILDGFVNTNPALQSPDGDGVSVGMVALNAPIPFDLDVGDYTVSVSLTQSNPNGQFYQEDGEDALDFGCRDVDPLVEALDCGYFPFSLNAAGDSISFSSEQEQLRIVAASAKAVVDVNAPASLSIFALGLGLLLARRRSI